MFKNLKLTALFAFVLCTYVMQAQVFGVYAPCPSSSYLPSSLYYLEDNGNATLIGPVTLNGTPLIVNGLGYHTGSGKLFAMSSNAQNLYAPVNLYSIEPTTGAASLRGTITEPPGDGVTLPLIEYTTALSFVADVDEDGIYRIPGLTFVTHVVTGAITNVKLYLGSFNPATSTSPTWQQLSMDAATLAIMNNFIAQTQAFVLCGGGSSCPKPEGGIQDWVYSDGKLISYFGVEKKLFSLDIATLSVTTTTPSVVLPTIPGSNEMGGIFKDNEGNFYAVQVYTGKIYLFDPVTGDILNPNAPYDLELDCSLGDNASNPVGSAPLPVTMLSFSASAAGSQAVLNWTSTAEHDLFTYEIQRLSADKKWLSIGNTTPNSNKFQSSVYHYSFSDANPVAGTNIYRIKIIDKSGMYTYSNVESINFENKNTFSVFPNPAHEFITINGSGESRVVISDISGKVVLESEKSVNRIDISTLPNGVYIVRINGSNTEQIKFVKI